MIDVPLENASHPRRILGIDPGLHITGYGVLEANSQGPRVVEAGVLTTEKQDDMAARLCTLYAGIIEIIDQFTPEIVVVEALYAHYKHPRTAILMGHARGVLFLAAAQRSLELVSYNATRIKKTVTGSGRAAKDQVQRTIQRELGLAQPPEPVDVSDALAAALCHYYRVRTS